jgi:HSP20 family protein
MAHTKEIARTKEPAPESPHGLLDWLPRPGWLDAFEHAFEATPMRIEERVDADEYVVRAELPGIDPDQDVEINVGNGMLQIRAERREERHEDEGKSRRSEFHYGYFSRVISLPAGARQSDVKATYHDGILEVRLPVDHTKSEATKVPVSRV